MAYINDQVAREDARKAALESRGLTVVTSSGAIVTLLFGLAAITLNRTGYTLPHSAKLVIVGAIVAFFISALCAIVTNYPFEYDEVKPDALRTAIRENWSDPAELVEKNASLTQVNVWESARAANNKKAAWLLWGVVGQVLAVALVAAALALALVL